jgi:hypothetical protein
MPLRLAVAALLSTAAFLGISHDARGAPRGNLDCNGFSAIQAPLKSTLVCADPIGRSAEGFEDNEHYVGHDEASLAFYSTTPGSGNSARYFVTLPQEPLGAPNGTVAGPVWDFQTQIAPWFSMVMCDTESFPETRSTCTPDSDTNIQVPPTPDHAGAAFMELQLYPPGYSPFISRISCDQIHWCTALTIDSLEGNFDFSNLNPNCTEPVNFAFLTHDGVPIGPPGPDTANATTLTPTSDVLLMNPGDRLRVTMHDTFAGFFTEIRDLTTGQSGTMVASIPNGFRHILWDPVNHTCIGEPYAFHPMFSTAAPPTSSGEPRAWAAWTAHTLNVSYTVELGHFETPDLGGGSGEGRKKEEGPCFTGPTIPGCLGFDNLDVDFDGFSYEPDYPNGTGSYPTPTFTSSPRSFHSGSYSAPYAKSQFETDILAIQALQPRTPCDIFAPAGCSIPPRGASFYPWFHLASPGGTCAWTLSNDGIPNQTDNFGGETVAWGPPELTDYGGGFVAYENFASGKTTNPCP